MVGRKAWNFYASPKGAESSSIAYSIIETAKANNLNVFKYLTYLFKELPNTPFKEEPELLEFPIEYITTRRFHNMLCLLDTLIRKYRAFDYENKK